MNHKVERVDNLMYDGCEPHWHCTKCDNYWPFHCYTNTQLENMECNSVAKGTSQLYDYCHICGRRIVVGETHYDLVNGETICTNCCTEVTYETLSNMFCSGNKMTIGETAEEIIKNGWIKSPKIMPGTKIFRKCCGKVIDWTVEYVKLFTNNEYIFIDDSDNEFSIEDLGETVFLTEEEALNSTEKTE